LTFKKRPVTYYIFQAPVVDSVSLDAFVHEIWKDIADIEQAESAPLLEIEPASIEFGRIGCVIPSKHELSG
jgi:hypothetical protein